MSGFPKIVTRDSVHKNLSESRSEWLRRLRTYSINSKPSFKFNNILEVDLRILTKVIKLFCLGSKLFIRIGIRSFLIT